MENLKPNIIFLCENENGLWCIDLKQNQARILSNNQITSAFLKNKDVYFSDAKKIITQFDLQKHEEKWFCLITIKTLLSKTFPAKPLEIPNFANEHEALLWALQSLQKINESLSSLKLERLCRIECDVIPVLIDMEKKGLPFNRFLWQKHLLKLNEKQNELKEKLNDAFTADDKGFDLFEVSNVNLNDAATVKEKLEKILNIKLLNTSSETLKKFNHQICDWLISYRENAKILSLYGDSFLQNLKDDRIRGTFVPLGCSSGRIACRQINLQALPNDERFQECITAKDNQKLIYFDYDAFELRILASLSNDEAMMRIFADGQDIHAMVAQSLFKTKVTKEINKDLRNKAKIINFGIVYGMGEQSLAKKLGMNSFEAAKLLENYFKNFSSIKGYLYSLENQAQEKNFVATALGRRLYFNSDKSKKTVARNMPIQGSGADIIKLAMILSSKELKKQMLKAHLVNSIHDELVVETLIDEEAKTIQIVENAMKKAFEAVLGPKILANVSFSS